MRVLLKSTDETHSFSIASDFSIKKALYFKIGT
jgi:hypothetical protein